MWQKRGSRKKSPGSPLPNKERTSRFARLPLRFFGHRPPCFHKIFDALHILPMLLSGLPILLPSSRHNDGLLVGVSRRHEIADARVVYHTARRTHNLRREHDLSCEGSLRMLRCRPQTQPAHRTLVVRRHGPLTDSRASINVALNILRAVDLPPVHKRETIYSSSRAPRRFIATHVTTTARQDLRP